MDTERPIWGICCNTERGTMEGLPLTVAEAIGDITALLELGCGGDAPNLTLLQILYDLTCCVTPDPTDLPALAAIAQRWRAETVRRTAYWQTRGMPFCTWPVPSEDEKEEE